MADSLVEVFNNALLALGVSDQIISITDPVAAPLKLNWPMTADAVARAYPWNSLSVKEYWNPRVVPLVEIDPDFEYQFNLPPTCVRIYTVDDNNYPWEIRGRILYTQVNAPRVHWIKKFPEDISQVDSLCIAAATTRLAHACCFKILQSNSSKEQLWQDYRQQITEARGIDAQEASPKDFDNNTWVNTRTAGEW